MRRIAEKHIEALEKPAAKLPRLSDILVFFKRHQFAFIFGLTSLFMYGMLYEFSASLTHIAQETHAGHKTLFFVPIVIALVFSLVHGSFTSHFWDSLGIKAKSKAA